MKIKKILILLLLISIFIFLNENVFANDEPNINAKSAILIDNKTNKILYNKNSNDRMFPASTTKIMTAILAIENCNLNDKATASYNAVMTIPSGYSTANIQIDEELTIEQLLELLLVHSANDAANVLAEYVGGSVDSFVSMMNTKANELGLSGTHFTNPYGLHDDNHYTTAHDLAILMQYCFKNDTFKKICGQASCAIPQTNKSDPRKYSSTNEMLVANNSNYYPYLSVGKTGFTTEAGECLVSVAYHNDLELIGVILNSNSRFNDTRSLYDYGFNNFSIQNIVKEKDTIATITVANATLKTKNLELLVSEDIPVLASKTTNLSDIKPQISLNSNISAPIEEGSILGKVTYTVEGVGYTTNLIAANSVQKSKITLYILYGSIICLILIVFLIFFLH